eukprot:1190336-Prorocentrum_minimum.AAC.4
MWKHTACACSSVERNTARHLFVLLIASVSCLRAAESQETNTCPAGCTDGGTCNYELGRCDCPPFAVETNDPDAPCSKLPMPACEVLPGLVSPCGKVRGGRTSCHCLEQCKESNVLWLNECYDLNATRALTPEHNAMTDAQLNRLGFLGHLPMVYFERRPPRPQERIPRAVRTVATTRGTAIMDTAVVFTVSRYAPLALVTMIRIIEKASDFVAIDVKVQGCTPRFEHLESREASSLL